MTRYETVIGLEVHAQLNTKSKIFCSCSTETGKSPNENTCPVCLGLPGVLPVLNKSVVESALQAGLATGCSITKKNIFARKNYFYPDLPKGYQISQFDLPIAVKGSIEIETDGIVKQIGLTRIHMEEDAGKLLHEHPKSRSKAASWVDLNRAGTPLIEIVSEPDMRSPKEAIAYLKELRNILLYLEINDGRLEDGSFRCDANISLRPVGQKEFGTRTELKNMNSFNNIERAMNFEIQRQADVLEGGGKIHLETLLWDPDTETTRPMRSKEESHDYRYFPDPDLLPLMIEDAQIQATQKALPELPRVRQKRFEIEYTLNKTQSEAMTATKSFANYFEASVKAGAGAKEAANWIRVELAHELAESELSLEQSKLSAEKFAAILKLLADGAINRAAAKTILSDVFKTGADPKEVVAQQGLTQVSDSGELDTAVQKVMDANPKEMERLKGGEQKLISFFMGQVMKETKGKANPKLVTEILRKKLK